MDTYEKKYNEALERARNIKSKILQSHLSTESCKAVSEYIDEIIPELKSDDETTRNEILAYIGSKLDIDLETHNRWCSYLEKQKEQKPAEKQDYSGLNDLERTIHRGFLSAGVENVPVTIIKETAKECLAQMKPAEWSEEDEEIFNNIIEKAKGGHWIEVNEITWLINRFKSLRPQPKQEWSKEDENKIERLAFLISVVAEKEMISPEECIDLRNFIKSFRPQPHEEKN